jgi:acyl-CoA synthetase (AMP-forming)/AMP-acid ligase II
MSPLLQALPERAIDSTPILGSIERLVSERRRGVTFVRARGRLVVPYADLVDRARRVATALRSRGLRPGDAVVVVLPDPEEAIAAILGAMAAGVAPAPIYPPTGVEAMPVFLRHLAHLLESSGARRVIAAARLMPFLGAVPQPVDAFAELLDAAPGPFERPSADDTAFLQFTSGTTAAPRGVMVTHGNLAANLGMIRAAARVDDTSKIVTWLPVYHDMGLVGAVLSAISAGIELSVMQPQTFLRSPRLWLEEISRVGGTHSAAPNFAYGLCVKRLPDVAGLDLSSMRVFICGAEPILPATLERFNAHFAPTGLHPGAVTPAYGLAEATLAVTFAPYLRGLCCDESRTPRVSSCGVPLPGLEVRVAGERGRELGERHVGEVQVRGPTVTPGYVRNPDETRAARAPDGWLRTGDLGYLADGELYLLGRRKDVIIVRGRNLYAHDIEGVAGEHPDVRTGNVAAFGVPATDTEALVVVVESRRPEDGARIAREVRGRLAEVFGVVPHDVRVVGPGTLPKTSSGKLKRGEMRARYLAGRLSARRSRIETGAVILRSWLGHLDPRRSRRT